MKGAIKEKMGFAGFQNIEIEPWQPDNQALKDS